MQQNISQLLKSQIKRFQFEIQIILASFESKQKFSPMEVSTTPDRKPITLTQQQADKLLLDLQAFQKEFETQKQDFASSDETVYYIVSSRFLKEWKTFATDTQLERLLPSPLNADILEDKKLKPDLLQGEDFYFVSQNLYKTITKLPKIERFDLKRKVITIGKEKRVPVYLKEFNYVLISHQALRLIDRNNSSFKCLETHSVQASEYHTVEDFLDFVMAKQRFVPSIKEMRLWKIGQKTLGEVQDEIKHQTNQIRSMDIKIKFKGKPISVKNTKIGDMQFDQNEFLVVQVKDNSKKWHLLSDNEGKCENCYNITELKIICGCKKAAYCSEQCQERDKRFHNRDCSHAEMQEILKPVEMQLTQTSARGRVGLSNLGNTCFMNSCLQCLSNTEPLTQYFLARHFQKEINLVNPLGKKGKLAKTYAKFIKAMWCDSNSTFSPYNIKNAVSSINPMFSGYQQHDSQEFFSFLVDGIHQDLNRIEKKPVVQSIDSNGRPDHVVALESWINYTKRNQSIIIDLMTGQYRSKVTCPDCQRESITFDPFTTVALPIPSKSLGDSKITLDQCFRQYEEVEKLDEGNEWYCSHCKDFKLAFKELSIYKAPKILILHLKRFKAKSFGRRQKNDASIELPKELNMKDYLIDPFPMSSYIEELKQQNVYVEPKTDKPITESEEPIYELYAVSNHYGGLGGGHYTAYAKNNGKWFEFNDSSVRACSESNVGGSGAYLLFYKRKD